MENRMKHLAMLFFAWLICLPAFSQIDAPGYQGRKFKIMATASLSPGALHTSYAQRDENAGIGLYTSLKSRQRETDGIVLAALQLNKRYGLTAEHAISRTDAIGVSYNFFRCAAANGIGVGSSDLSEIGDYIESYGGLEYQDLSVNMITVYYTRYEQVAPTGTNGGMGIGRIFYNVENAPEDRFQGGGMTYLMMKYGSERILFDNMFLSISFEFGWSLGGGGKESPGGGFTSNDSNERLQQMANKAVNDQTILNLNFGISYVL